MAKCRTRISRGIYYVNQDGDDVKVTYFSKGFFQLLNTNLLLMTSSLGVGSMVNRFSFCRYKFFQMLLILLYFAVYRVTTHF